MKDTKKMLSAVIAVMSLMTTAVSCSEDKSKAGGLVITETTTAPTSEEPVQTVTDTKGEPVPVQTTATVTAPAKLKHTAIPKDIRKDLMPEEEAVDISGTEIVWLSDYDLNPAPEQPRSTALALFEDVYGGKINYVYTSARNKYTTLSAMLLSGEEVDMFEYEQGDFPKGVLSQQYQPLDPYFRSIGMNYGIWEEMEDAIYAFEYMGSHYVMPYSLSNPVVLTYSRKLMDDYKLDDPYELYQEDKWDWDSFLKIAESYHKKTGNPAIRGDFGDAFIHSSGYRIIGYKNGFLTNNINHAPLRNAELFMQKLNDKSLSSSYWNEYYTADSLFYASESWTLGKSNVMNPGMDLMVVPVPKKTGTEGNYITCSFDAKMLVRNSEKGDAVATYIMCERIVASQEEYKEGAKTYATTPELSVNGSVKSYITEEQYDALQEYTDPSKVTPVFDYIYGMGDALAGSGGIMDSLANIFIVNKGTEEDWKNIRNLHNERIKEVMHEYQ